MSTLQFNGVQLTTKSISATRDHYIGICVDLIALVKTGELKVNDPAGYIQQQMDSIKNTAMGNNDHTLAFRQYAYYLQTGESVALLP